MQRIAVLTSGGDAPGMNAAIRAVTRTALDKGWEVFGVQNGYAGLISDEIIPLDARAVSGIIQQGGTRLGSARSKEFKTEQGRKLAIQHLTDRGIEKLVVIGGNGSQSGANALHEMGFPVNGVASTIDNDLLGSDITIGVDTALNIALEAIDRLKVTASSHQRTFLVEVMGRNCGYLALMAAIAGGAEGVVIPEIDTTPEQVAEVILDSYERRKSHVIIVVAEGAEYNVDKLKVYFDQHTDEIRHEIRATTLGHVQRGGTPGAYDRLLGSRLGAAAVDAFERGESGVLMGLIGNKICATPLAEVAGKTKQIDRTLFRLATVLAR